MLVAVCSTATVTDIDIDVRGSGHNWKTLYSATGSIAVEPGFVFASDEVLPGFESTSNGTADLAEVDEILVSLTGASGGEWSSLTSFQLPPDGVPLRGWLHSDGRTTDEPCPS